MKTGAVEMALPNIIVQREGERVVVTYYKTAIVTFDAHNIWLNTGGWWTWSTMRYMNWASRTYDLRFQVRQAANQQWTIAYHGKQFAYKQEIVRLERQTGVVSPLQNAATRAQQPQNKTANTMSYQQIILVGNTSRDAEQRISRTGDVRFATFSMTVNDRRGQTSEFPIVVFGKQGESVAQSITKGQHVVVEGWIQTKADGRFNVVARRVECEPKSVKQ